MYPPGFSAPVMVSEGEGIEASSKPPGGAADARVVDFSSTVYPESPPGVATAYDAAFASARRYPVGDYCEFRGAAADRLACDPWQVLPATGAPAALRLILHVACDPGDRVLLPEPSADLYAREVRLRGARPRFVPEAGLPEADPTGHALAVVPTPADPTGRAHDTGALCAFFERCRETDTTVVVDETYLPFTDRPSFTGTPGVVVVRDLAAPFGLPGIGAGFLVATDDLRDRLDAARLPDALSAPAAAVGTHCLDRWRHLRDVRRRVADERACLADRLAERFDVLPSEAPFLLLDTGERDPASVVARARSRGVLVRDATTFRGLDSHVRVAVRRPAENDRLLAALLDA